MSVLRFVMIAVTCLPMVVEATIEPDTRERLNALSVPFVPNSGQWDGEAAFAARLFAGTLFVTGDGGLVYRLGNADRPLSRHGGRVPTADPMSSARHAPRQGWVLRETLVDAQGAPVAVRPSGTQPQVGRVSYAIGSDESQHRDRLPTFERIDLGEVYPGVAAQLRATGANVEKIFTVSPGADPSIIRIRVDGANAVGVDARGALIADTGNGPVAYTPPIAYQERADGTREKVDVRYMLESRDIGQEDGAVHPAAPTARYRFVVGAYDHDRALVIDPLLQSTYIGGNNMDFVSGIAIHPVTGDVYVVGSTQSTDFPKVTGAEQTGLGGAGWDAYVMRLNSTLTTRFQATYVGGSGDDFGNVIAIHPTTGEVYIAGETASSDMPKVGGSEQSVKAAGKDAFVMRLNAALTARLQSSYLGGSGDETAVGIAIHPSTGEVYVAGQTTSTDFPKVAGAEQTTKGAGNDAFVTRFNAALTARLQSTYVGGAGEDVADAIAIHPFTGEIYIGGVTSSADLPKVAGSDQSVRGVNYDGFVTRLNAALTVRLQSTYLGGNANDQVNELAIHPFTGEVYATGHTTSTDFPKLAGAEQSVKNTANDGYVTRFNAALTSRLQSTLIGGSGEDLLFGLAIHPLTGEIYVGGFTDSPDFPKVTGGDQPIKSGATDLFIARLNAALTAVLQSTYVGGTLGESGGAVRIHPSTGDVYVAGGTASTDFPKTSGSEQPTKAGGNDAFISRYTADLTANDNMPDAFGNFAAQSNVPVLTARTSNALRVTGIFGSANVYVDGQPGSAYCMSSTNGCACDVSAGFQSTPGTVANNAYVCVRHTSSPVLNQLTRTNLHVGGTVASFVATTGTLIGGGCTLDVDGDGGVDALSDGLLLLRAMFGLTGTPVTAGATRGGASRTTWAQIQSYLNGNCGASFAP